MRILLANPRGFCAGVVRAVEAVESALQRFGPPVYVRHKIVHNPHVVARLQKLGAVFVEEPHDAPEGAVLIFSAHGVSPAVREAGAQRRQQTLDATCPLVTKVHNEALRFAREGYEIILVGHADHVEIQGTFGHAPQRTQLCETVRDAETLQVQNPRRLAVLTQTTLSVDDTREILAVLRRRFPQIHLPRKGDICYATQNRQNAVKTLAKEAALVLVIGAPDSSNSKRLVEVAQGAGARAVLVQSAAEIRGEWLANVDCVGITAGASAPEHLVQEAAARLAELAELAGGPAVVEAQPFVDEGVTFQAPAGLRE